MNVFAQRVVYVKFSNFMDVALRDEKKMVTRMKMKMKIFLFIYFVSLMLDSHIFTFNERIMRGNRNCLCLYVFVNVIMVVLDYEPSQMFHCLNVK